MDDHRHVPRGQPQTKPKACNVGLFLARGEYLVIFDAEDRPDPDQLKKAIVAFGRGGEQMVCVQAALNYWNVYENFLTRMFTAEYSFWFDYMLPGLDALHLPIPLGGTSNHFRTDGLRGSAAGTRSTSPRTPTWASARPRSATRSASSTRPRTRRPTGTSATGSGSAPAGSRATCRPRWCTRAARWR